ncbi:hypothetical protein GCM10028805_51920 [Spirosoma harenae]
MTESEYIAYFENIAAQHAAIRHNVENRKAFFVVHDDNLSELETAIPNMSLPALLLDQYYDDLDAESDNKRITVLGGISIICKVEMGNTKSIRQAREQARQIARSILNRLRYECQMGLVANQPYIKLSFNQNGSPTPAIAGGSATGWGYSFELLMPTKTAIKAEDWLDK